VAGEFQASLRQRFGRRHGADVPRSGCVSPLSFPVAFVLTYPPSGNTARVFGNKVAKEVHQIELEKGKDLDFSDIAHLVAGKRGREAEKNGDADGGIWTAGMVIGLVDDIPTVR
jgi:NAD(P)H-dependent flavin oxidoreductase YrpB (nitropropane dioxygenase family)